MAFAGESGRDRRSARVRRAAYAAWRGGVEGLESRELLSSYYVSPGGSDAGAGTAAAPWATLQKAANAVRAGDTVIVRAGTYAGFNLTADGTAAAPITFKADPGVVLNRRNGVTSDVINLEGATFVTLDGFRIQDSPRHGIRVTGGERVTLRNNVVERSAMVGIFTSFSNDTLIENNVTVNSVTSHGIYASNSGDRPTIRNNRVSGNYGNGIHLNGDISMGGDGIVSGALIEGNVIHENGLRGGSAINGDGLQNSVIRNNLLYGNHASGISLYVVDAAEGSKNNLVVNNTIVQPAGARWAVNIKGGSTGNRVFNNVLLNANTSAGAISVSGDSLAGFVSDYNAGADRMSTDGGGSVVSLASWRSATGQDGHSFVASATQLFVNAAANDYHLLAASPAKDKGVAVLGGVAAPAADLEGRGRPQGAVHDMGAYELIAVAPPPPPPPPPSVGFSVAGQTAGEGAGTVTITVVRTGDLTATSAVSFATVDGAALAGADYTAAAGSLTFAPGESVKTFVLQLLDDGVDEPDEALTVVLSAPVGGTLGEQRSLAVTLTDNDEPVVPPPPPPPPPATSSVSGAVFNDANGNGARDAGEAGLAAWRVYLDRDRDGTWDLDETSAATDAAGNYRFDNLAEGSYRVAQVLATGWKAVAAGRAFHDLSLAAGVAAGGYDFADAQPAAIRGTVFLDRDGDGRMGKRERRLSGWTVFLDADGDGVLDAGEQRAVTDGNGNYAFADLDPGRYTVRVVQQSGYIASAPTGGSYVLTLAGGQAATNKVFGQRRIA